MILIGNLGRDPEIKTSSNGSRTARLNIATSNKWTDKNTGEKRERTHWHTAVIFNETLVGIVEMYCKKGSKIYIEGEHQTRKYTDKEGVVRYPSELVINGFGGKITLLDRNEGDGSRPMPEPDDYDQGAWAET
jgi:single-strand DNA-binding protein